MKQLYANYVFAVLLLFFCKIMLIDQVRSGFRADGPEPVTSNSREIAQVQTRLAPIR